MTTALPKKRKKAAVKTAQHRPATRRRRFKHDTLVAVDLFSGFGGMTRGIEAAGIDVISAANHAEYKVEVHEANHPNAEHWIADLVDREASNYHSVRDLPPGDMLCAGVSCVNHSPANTKKPMHKASRYSTWTIPSSTNGSPSQSATAQRPTASCTMPPNTIHA